MKSNGYPILCKPCGAWMREPCALHPKGTVAPTAADVIAEAEHEYRVGFLNGIAGARMHIRRLLDLVRAKEPTT